MIKSNGHQYHFSGSKFCGENREAYVNKISSTSEPVQCTVKGYLRIFIRNFTSFFLILNIFSLNLIENKLFRKKYFSNYIYSMNLYILILFISYFFTNILLYIHNILNVF